MSRYKEFDPWLYVLLRVQAVHGPCVHGHAQERHHESDVDES